MNKVPGAPGAVLGGVLQDQSGRRAVFKNNKISAQRNCAKQEVFVNTVISARARLTELLSPPPACELPTF
jgi:hypothetical protein